MISEQTKAKYEELAERVRSRRAINWQDVAKRLKSIRQKVEGNGSNCCNQQAWKRIIFPEEAETSRSSISKLENGDQIPSADILARYAAAGGVSLEWLLYGEGKEEAGNIVKGSPRGLAREIAKFLLVKNSPFAKHSLINFHENQNSTTCTFSFDYSYHLGFGLTVGPLEETEDYKSGNASKEDMTLAAIAQVLSSVQYFVESMNIVRQKIPYGGNNLAAQTDNLFLNEIVDEISKLPDSWNDVEKYKEEIPF